MSTPTGPTRSSSVTDRAKVEPRLRQPGAAASRESILICSLLYSLVLILSINGHSLWTDEAFSAWLAGHASLSSLFHSLAAGDSSDLQTSLYYLWLFFWSKLFGTGELALRAANIPFILIFSFALVWTSFRIFGSRFAWLAPALLPFVWQYAAEARAYMAMLAFSTAALASLFGFARARTDVEARKFAWLFLISALLGTLFHMLFLLVVPPALIVVTFHIGRQPRIRWSQWRTPLTAFALPLLALGTFLAWTFTRAAIAYDYPRPSFKAMGSVFFELAGFSGFGPNRKLSLDFRAYEIPLALGGLALFGGLGLALLAGYRNRKSAVVPALGAALFLCCLEALALAFLSGKQPDARHLTALVTVFLFLVMALLAQPGRTALAALLVLSAAWMSADVRLALLPEYRKENFRDAVADAIAIHNRAGAEIALAADPAPPGYYGLDVRGEAPCIPFGQPCTAAMEKTNWARTVPAWDAESWSGHRILTFLAKRDRPVVVILQLDRSRRKSAWSPILAANASAPRDLIHGFEVILVR
jgi:hypothetical protein